MASRNGRTNKQIKAKYEQKASNALAIAAVIGLVLCSAINAVVLVLAPAAASAPVPTEAFWGLIAALAPDFIKFIRGEKA